MEFDLTLFNFLHGLAGRSALTGGFVVFFAEYFSYIFLVVLIIFLHTLRGLRERLFAFLFLIFVGLISKGIIGESLHLFLQRLRPHAALHFTPLISVEGFSFPSGHAVFFFAIAFAVLYFRRSWGYLFLAGAFVIGIHRVMAGLHWPTDILGGMAVGAISFVIAWTLLVWYKPGGEKEVEWLRSFLAGFR